MNVYQIVDEVRGVTTRTPNGIFECAAVRLACADRPSSVHICLVRNIGPNDPCLLRLNSACATSELFGCERCDCAWQLSESLRRFSHERSCALIHTFGDEGRGHGVFEKLRSYLESDGTAASGLDRRYLDRPDLRDFEAQAFVARWLGVRVARLISDNSRKREALCRSGIRVTEVIGLRTEHAAFTAFYRMKDSLDGYCPEASEEGP